MEIITNQSSCEWRLTPWDSRVFGFPTSESRSIQYADNEIVDLFNKIDAINEQESVKLTYFRHDSNDQLLKRAALENGYSIKEFSLYTYHNNVSKIPKTPRSLDFRRATREDLKQIQHIASSSFTHGRFHEDPFIQYELAQRRYENWIGDLIDTEFFVFDIKNQIGGFFSYAKKDNEIEMPISGLSQDALRLGGFLWVNMFHFIYERENISKIRNLVSGSNMAVINLYARLGFTFEQPMFGYHKFY